MPHKPHKQCSVPGCPAIIKVGQIYCIPHQKENFKSYERSRDKETKRRYSRKAWRDLRALKLSRYPLCQDCFEDEGRVVAAVMVHHEDEVSEGGKFLAPLSELRSLCKRHHNKRHPKGVIREQANK